METLADHVVYKASCNITSCLLFNPLQFFITGRYHFPNNINILVVPLQPYDNCPPPIGNGIVLDFVQIKSLVQILSKVVKP